MTDKLIKIALLISIVTYQFWYVFPKGTFYVSNAIFIVLLSIIIFLSHKSLWAFMLICLAINNLMDELFFEPAQNQLNEVVLLIFIPVIWYIRKRYNDRKNFKR